MSKKHDFRHLDDTALVELCNSGDTRSAKLAFSELYSRHKQFVLRVAQNITHDSATAVDALQETFMWLLRQFPPAGSGLKLTAKMTTLLYPVTRNYAISEWRRMNRGIADADPDLLPTPPVYNDADVSTVLRELPRERREVVSMRFVHDMSLNDIAAALGIPAGTVKSRLHAAVTQMRNSPKIKRFFEK